MTKIKLISNTGEVKAVPPRFAAILLRLGKHRRLDDVVPPAVEAAPIAEAEPEPIVEPNPEPEPEPEPVDEAEPVAEVEVEEEPKPKRRYRRRDVQAE